MTEFEKMINVHKRNIETELNIVCNEFLKRAKEHDNDKVEPGIVNDIYNEHFPTLKTIEFGTAEYLAYEKKYFIKAHELHAQNRHHYYSKYNTIDDVNLFDVIEALVDIRQSQKQYADYSHEKIVKTLIDKEVVNLDIKQLIVNTVLKLEELSEEKNK